MPQANIKQGERTNSDKDSLLEPIVTQKEALMTTPKDINRRTLLRVGLSTVAGMSSATLWARSSEDSGGVTPSQTAGPFFPIKDQADKDLDLTLIQGHSAHAEGQRIHLSGQVLDNQHQPIPDALVDIWQANRHGRYHHEQDPNPAPLDPNFQGWGQIKTDSQGYYRCITIVPGAYPVNGNWWRPPHIHFKVSKRGYHELTTQMYFAGHPLNTKDHLLLEIPESERHKLIVSFSKGTSDQESEAYYGQFDLIVRRVHSG
jgi:protocatechuate 3,4-dioxygenase beta subunit